VLARVSMTNSPDPAGVHAYQTDAPPASPAWSGSPSSFVPATVIGNDPVNASASAKSSLAGRA
jgi:hypothetical protein